MKFKAVSLAALTLLAGAAQAQSSVTVYGRVDLSAAQQADAVDNKQIRNGSGSRLGFRGVEELGGGLRAVFQLEHRFNANDGSQSTTRFWEGKSVVGLEGGFGRVLLGREENPAFTFSHIVADPWGFDTVASNGSIANGRIGTTRYSNSVNYRYAANGFGFGAQIAEASANVPTGGNADDRPYSLGTGYRTGAWVFGAGFENPADQDDHWATVNASYDFGIAKVGGLLGTGKNVAAQKIQAYLVSVTAPVAGGQLRGSYGQLKNKDIADGVLDKQFALGYHYPLSKRTTVYADVVNERRDNMAAGLKKTGYDLGIKHNF